MPKVNRKEQLPSLYVSPSLIVAIAKVLDDPATYRSVEIKSFTSRSIEIELKKEELSFDDPAEITDEHLKGRVESVIFRWAPLHADGHHSHVRIRLSRAAYSSDIRVEINSPNARISAETAVIAVLATLRPFQNKRQLLHISWMLPVVIVGSILTSLQLNLIKMNGPFEPYRQVFSLLFTMSMFAYIVLNSILPYNVFSEEQTKTLLDARRRLLWAWLGIIITLPLTLLVLPYLKNLLGIK